jgi:hypothetical protein
MKITNDWLIEFCTERGGWTSEQFKVLGIGWPPPNGWKHRVIGKEISEGEAAKFEQGRYALSPRTLKNLAKKARRNA